MFEIDAENLMDVLHKFQNYYRVSKETMFIEHNNEIIGIYGIRNVNDFTGIPWLLTIEMPVKYINSFLRFSSDKMKALQKEYLILYNYTSEQNKVSHRWSRYLGFTIDEENPLVTPNKKTLFKFEWRKE